MPAVRCTVAVPVYNRRELTLRAVRSALDQDLDEVEVLAVDDCSTDGVGEALREVRDPRFRLVRNPANLGLFGNFNRCLDLASGEFVRLLCCDDRLAPGCLKIEAALLAAHPSAVVLSTRGRLVAPDGRNVGVFARHLPAGLYRGPDAIRTAVWVHARYGFNPFNYPSGVILRRAAVDRAGRFDTGMRVAGDVDLFLRTLRFGDLLVAEHVGCEILSHPGQVNQRLAREGHHLLEQWEIARRHAGAFGGPHRLRPVGRGIAGLALGLELLFAGRGDWTAAANYARVRRRTGVPWAEAVFGLADTFGRRLSDAVLGYRPIPPVERVRPLPGTPPGSPPRTAPR